jgi:hypothetical protein
MFTTVREREYILYNTSMYERSLTVANILGSQKYALLLDVPQTRSYVLYKMYESSLTFVKILGFQKCALLHDVPETWFNNWPDDDSLSRNRSPL